MRLIVGITVLLSAALLFLVQPMTGRALLPGFGGAPVVWGTSLVFYQAVVLVGYALAHAARQRFGVRANLGAAAALAAVGLVAIPLVLPRVTGTRPGAPPAEIAFALVLSVGLPVLALTSTSPALQAGFAATDDPRAGDPYAFFAVSNAGSLIALLAYPFVVEPAIGLGGQAVVWAAMYAVFLVSLATSAIVIARRMGRTRLPVAAQGPATDVDIGVDPAAAGHAIEKRRVAFWVLLAALPSGLTVAVTNVLTLDLASTPLLWTTPLALYLLGFVIAFAPRGARIVRVAGWLLPVGMIAVVLVAARAVSGPLWLVLAIHLVSLGLVAIVLHGRLASDRPHPERLTLFYLAVAVGGVVGGAAVALVAPLVFDGLTEYPLLLAAAAVLIPTAIPGGEDGRRTWRLDSRGVRVVIAMVVLVAIMTAVGGARAPLGIVMACLLSLLLIIPGRAGFAIAVGALLIVAETAAAPGILADRSYHSVLRVVDDGQGRRGLYSGTTLQGIQRLGEEAGTPIGYYRAEGPIGQVIGRLQAERPTIRMAVIGLGIGGLSAHARDADAVDFYELDPLVVRLATDPAVFSVLAVARGDIEVGVGDGRVLLAEEPPASYDLIIVDAFTSNAIPAHLLTVEAITSAIARLAPDSVLALHVSNRHAELEPVVGAAARDLGLAGLTSDDPGNPLDQIESPASHWVLLSQQPATLVRWRAAEGWREVAVPAGYRPWTDDRMDLLAAVRWDR